jgi:hypothetical protein
VRDKPILDWALGARRPEENVATELRLIFAPEVTLRGKYALNMCGQLSRGPTFFGISENDTDGDFT